MTAVNGIGRTTGRSRGGSGDVFTLLSSCPETNPTRKNNRRYINMMSSFMMLFLTCCTFCRNGSDSVNDNVSEWVKEQEVAFIRWINQHLKSSEHQISISDLRSSLQDGLVLIALMKTVAPQSIQFVR